MGDTGPMGNYLEHLDELLDSLRDVEARLAAISDGFEERIQLREQQRELRAMAMSLRQKARAPEEVTRELSRLRRLRDEVLDGHLSVGHIGGGNGPGGGGIEPRDVFAMNQAIDVAWGRADLEARIERLEVELRDHTES